MSMLMFDSCFYAAGLKADDRTEVQNEWMQGKVLVIVATISFGMGVDKADVRWGVQCCWHCVFLFCSEHNNCAFHRSNPCAALASFDFTAVLFLFWRVVAHQ